MTSHFRVKFSRLGRSWPLIAIFMAVFLMQGTDLFSYAKPNRSAGALSEGQLASKESVLRVANAQDHLLASAQATQQTSSEKKADPYSGSKARPVLEAKVGYFFFSDEKMNKIYDHGGLDLQISGSYPVWRWLQIYSSVEYLERHGRSLHGHQKTWIWEIPLSLGLKPVKKICSWAQVYMTIGPRYFFVHQSNNSSYVNRDVSHNGLGGFLNAGFNFFPMTHFVIDVFGEYSYKRIHCHSGKKNVYTRSMQVGGFTFGVGLGYAF